MMWTLVKEYAFLPRSLPLTDGTQRDSVYRPGWAEEKSTWQEVQ
jgi:hypothetical protein